MAAGGKKSGDLYAVLGLKKECSDADLRIAYKKLAMRWHPDKFSASGNAKRVEEAKEKFQQIQGAYSVLSDSSKRFLYDVGAYDSDDDGDCNGMEEFLGEMAQMMSQTKPNENGNETFEELQQLFVEMFQSDLGSGFGRGGAHGSNGHHDRASSSSSSMSPPGVTSISNGGSNGNKRDSSAMSSGKARTDGFNPSSNGFCFGINDSGKSSKGRGGGNSGSGKRRNGRKQKVSKHDVSSLDPEISA